MRSTEAARAVAEDLRWAPPQALRAAKVFATALPLTSNGLPNAFQLRCRRGVALRNPIRRMPPKSVGPPMKPHVAIDASLGSEAAQAVAEGPMAFP